MNLWMQTNEYNCLVLLYNSLYPKKVLKAIIPNQVIYDMMYCSTMPASMGFNWFKCLAGILLEKYC